MAKYYNRSRGPLNVPLRSGNSLSIPPKSWVEIPLKDEGSERVITYLRKGYLVRQAESPPPAPVKAPEVTESPKAPEAPVAEAPKEETKPEAEVVSQEPKAEALEESGDSEKADSPRRASKRGRRKSRL
jgi:hypothetical protein